MSKEISPCSNILHPPRISRSLKAENNLLEGNINYIQPSITDGQEKNGKELPIHHDAVELFLLSICDLHNEAANCSISFQIRQVKNDTFIHKSRKPLIEMKPLPDCCDRVFFVP